MKYRPHFFSYEEMSRNMAFDMGYQLLEEEGSVYEINDGNKQLVCAPTNPKTLWFETYLVMKARIAESDFRHKDYRHS